MLVNEALYSSLNGYVYQIDETETFRLEFYEDSLEFKFCELLALRRKLQSIDIIQLLSTQSADIEVIHLLHCDRFLILSIHHILELSELVNGAFAMMELNSVIHREIVRKIV